MTCIVGVVAGSTIWMGGDSLSSYPASYEVRRDRTPKVFRLGELLIGYTTSWRMGQLLQHNLTAPPQRHDDSDEKWLATAFIDAVRQVLKTGGFAHKENEVERGGTFLLGLRGKLYEVDSDYQVGAPGEPYGACGAGRPYALGALHTMMALDRPLHAKDRVRYALDAAAYHSAFVRAPYIILKAP
jgi:ATP-dependent protease HslVU (ClpYQ) peptidase subunit